MIDYRKIGDLYKDPNKASVKTQTVKRLREIYQSGSLGFQPPIGGSICLLLVQVLFEKLKPSSKINLKTLIRRRPQL